MVWFGLLDETALVLPTQAVTLMEPIAPDLLQNEANSTLNSQSPSPLTINDALPPELLLSVFDFIYTEMTQPLSFPHTVREVAERLRRNALLDVMLVCRAWCDLVASSPRYWTTIDVGIREQPLFWLNRTRGYREAQRLYLERQLTRSGQLPIQVNIGMDKVEDFNTTFDLLRNQANRWQALNLLTDPNNRVAEPIDQRQLENLLNQTLPCLTSLHIGPCKIKSGGHRGGSASLRVEAPHLRALSCELHLVIPSSTAHLIFLSITGVHLENLQPSVEGLRVEFDQLIELRIADCSSGAVLSTFSTPTLSKLVVDGRSTGYPVPQSLPLYPHLKELQWGDTGQDPTFSMLLPLCPNLTSFANYVVGLEKDEPIEEPPTIILEIPNIRSQMGNEERLWPDLVEVLVDAATCGEITELIDAVPSIQRIRVLRDPTTRGNLETQASEIQLLENLRERANVAVWLEPWGQNRGSS
ncbi:hypothetical protein FRC01_011058 [Tulasnella sp. 417]|nr:hypothetical protein FRC01_011058 [Tulasnella sp. 417]